MKESSIKQKLNTTLDKIIDNKKIFGAIANIQSSNNSFSWSKSAGNLNKNSQYAIASITKLYTLAAILKLRATGHLQLEDTLSKYFSKDFLCGLHTYKGIDYSENITIKQLLSHTTGLPDYYTQKGENGKSIFDEVILKDKSLSFDELILMTKKMKPKFKPDEKRKAFYSDINFDILGKIIEIITCKKLNEFFSEAIYEPLNLKDTYLYDVDSKDSFAPIYFKKQILHRPIFIASAFSSGGIVSNAQENMIFLRAFFEGKLFPKEYLEELYIWNRIQWFPLKYGIGMMQCKMSRLMSPLFPAPEIIGHSGSTGTFAFYCPKKDLFITGTINQTTKNPFQLVYRLLNCFD